MLTMAFLENEQQGLSGKSCRSTKAGKSDRGDWWGVLLAGGDGTRLRSLTRRIAGDDRPKQFCTILGRETLLDQTCRRAAQIIPSDRTLVVLTAAHERFYAPLLSNGLSRRAVVQPENRGTAPAILYSLLRIAAMTPMGSVAFFPSDHYVSDDEAFMAHVETAFEAVRARPELVILLGISPHSPEVEYGWIEPADPILVQGECALFRIHRFWEKPSFALAQTLLSGGCLWNSFVMVASVQSLLALIKSSVPDLYRVFASVRPMLDTFREGEAIQALYCRLLSSNFSQEVLAKRAANLAVLPVRGVDWSDWGEPSRVLASLAHIGMRPDWAETEVAKSA
jgi:mannose-1-phosphate guanylyltransferase